MTTFTDINSLASELVTRCYQVVGLDGGNGIGKTTLSNKIGEDYGFSIIHLDDFLNKNQDGYVGQIRVGELEEKIEASQKPLIIEGCCLREILKLLSIEAEAIVYMKLMRHGVWVEEREYDIKGSLEDHIAKHIADTKALAQSISGEDEDDFQEEDDYLSALTMDLFHYHSDYKPHTTAEYIFERHEDNS